MNPSPFELAWAEATAAWRALSKQTTNEGRIKCIPRWLAAREARKAAIAQIKGITV